MQTLVIQEAFDAPPELGSQSTPRWREMDSNCRFRAFLSLRSSSVFSIPRSRSAKGTDAESGTEAISLKPSSGKNRVGSRSLSAAHDSKLAAFPVYTSVGPSNVSRIFSATVAPTNAFPWRKPDAIHRRYLETSPRHCPGRSGRGAPRCLTAARLSAASPLPLTAHDVRCMRRTKGAAGRRPPGIQLLLR